MHQKIGQRIRQLRKLEHLTQDDFARRLGIKRGYVSTLETGRGAPSERLILDICRAFGAKYEWLKEGRGGHMFEVGRELSPKGRTIIEEVFRVIDSPDRIWAISEIAKLFNIDPDDPSKRLNLPSDFRDAVLMVMKIFQEGDSRKIKAVMSQLLALIPEVDWDAVKQKLKEDYKKLKEEQNERLRD